jgi:PKD domain
MYTSRGSIFSRASIIAIGLLAIFAGSVGAQSPITPITTENPKGNSFGMEGKISAPAPTQGARITTPSSGLTTSAALLRVAGICQSGLLVEVLDNGVLVGSTFCERGSFSLQISLFPGQNELSAKVYDDLGQAGPSSNTVIVQYSGGQFTSFGQSITLTSNFSRRAADPGSELTWPLQLSGGTGPYAFSIDWGDGSAATLKSQSVAGVVTISHIYKQPGIYRVTVRVTDSKGASGFLQLIAVSNGASSATIQSQDDAAGTTITKGVILWYPTLIAIAAIVPAFWLGGRYHMRVMRRKLEHDAAMIRKLEN